MGGEKTGEIFTCLELNLWAVVYVYDIPVCLVGDVKNK